MNKLKSARINSSCTIRNKIVYPVSFITQNQRKQSELTVDMSDCPYYKKYSEKNKSPNPELRQFIKTTQKFDQQDHSEYKKFVNFKKNFVRTHQQKLRDYFVENQKYDRKYFRVFKKQDKVFFKHNKQSSQNLDQEFQDTGRPVYDQIMNLKDLSQKEQLKAKHQEKLLNQKKLEEKQDKDYFQQRMDEYLKNEQKYFDKLSTIGEKELDKFQQKIELKQKYYYENVLPPTRQFVLRLQDLSLGKPKKPEYALSQPTMEDIPKIQNPQHQIKPSISKDILFFNQEQVIQEFYMLITLDEKVKIENLVVADPNYLKLVDKNGQTPLHVSLIRGNLGLSKFFIRKGISCDQPDHKGRTARSIAIDLKYFKILNFIKKLEQK
ncbi:hypothetical protein pb186bvf_017887 [Paramecium bursaria]